MVKLILSALIIVSIVAAFYFFVLQKNQTDFSYSGNNLAKKETSSKDASTKVTPTPVVSAEDDLTALEKDLAEITESEASFSEDVNSL